LILPFLLFWGFSKLNLEKVDCIQHQMLWQFNTKYDKNTLMSSCFQTLKNYSTRNTVSTRQEADLLVKEVVGKVVEHHRILGVNSVCFRQQLNTILDRLRRLTVQLQYRKTHQSPNTLAI